MTTPPAPEPPDARDPRTAAWLAVEPLDEVTRARLVRAALAAADRPAEEPGGDGSGRAPHRTARFLALAAALLVVLVVGLAVVVRRTSNDPTPTAADAPRAKAAPEAAQAPSAGGSGGTAEADATPTALPALGELGDVSTEAALSAAVAPRAAVATRTFGIVPACAVEAGRSLGTPVAAGTGTIDGKPATVVFVQRPDGLSGAIAVVNRTCEAVSSVLLP